MYQDFSRWRNPAWASEDGCPTDRATSRSTRSGTSDAITQATALPQSWPTTLIGKFMSAARLA
jgi:hypothetical protein